MKYLKLIAIFLIFENIQIDAQEYPTWYNLNEVAREPGYYPLATYIIDQDKLNLEEVLYLRGIPGDMTNVTFSRLFLSRGDGKDESKKCFLYACRGTLDEKEVLIIDQDLDYKISSNEILVLPDLVMSDSIDYDSLYIYPTSFNHIVELEYDHFVNNQFIKVPLTLHISVNSKYDISTKELYYFNNFVAGHYHNLECQIAVDEESSFQITTFNHLPWQSIYRFKLEQNGSKYDLNLREVFKVEKTDDYYQIDSIDIINKRILIKRVKGLTQYSIYGESINNFGHINTDSIRSSQTLVHYWGSWCKPCIKNLPKIVEIKASYPDLNIVGVAVDGGKESTLKLIDKNKMSWPNLYFENEQTLGNHCDLEINAYPTYILLDNKMNILAKSSDLEEITDKLE